MSIRVMTMVWERSTHKGSALLLMLAIADFADDQGNAYPSVEKLAGKIRMSERNTRYVLGELIESGELAIKRGGGRGGSNLYRILVERNLPLFEPGNPANFAGEKIAPATGSRETLQRASENPATAIAPEPSRTVIEPSGTPGARRVRKGKTAIPPDFGISEEVRAWAREHGYEPHLQAHLEYLTDYARSNGKLYADWDAAFRNAIRDDWGNVRKNGVKARLAPAVTCVTRKGSDMCGMPAKPRGGGVPRCDHCEIQHQSNTRGPMPAAAREMFQKIKESAGGNGPRRLFHKPVEGTKA